MRYGLLLASVVAMTGLAPIASMTGGSAAAQSLQAPAEMPPASYRSMQYVDSRGCAFVRAGSPGQVVWVPRVTRDRQQVCGQPPSGTGGQVTAPRAPAPAPLPAPEAVTAAATPRAASPAVEPPARPSAGAPITTVASVTTPPRLPAAVASAPPAFPSVPAATPAAATPRAITLAEACAGRTGPLSGYVNAATGEAVTCGPATAPIPAAAPLPAPVPAPVPAVAAVAAPAPTLASAPRGIPLAEACAGKSGLLIGYVSAATGQPVECPALPAAPQLTYAAVTPPPTYVPAPASSAPCPPGVLGGVAYRCGGGQGALTLAVNQSAQDSAGQSVGVSRAPAPATVQAVSRNPFLIDLDGPVPASNPPVGTPFVSPPPGYVSVFDDGRLNANRGPQRAVAQQVAHTLPYGTPQVQPQAAPQQIAVATGHRFVQVGSFGQSANAERAAASLRAMGLPVSVRASRGLQVVSAGPFHDAGALRAALSAARNAGFRDAYSR